MKNHDIFNRSFGKNDQKRFRIVVLVNYLLFVCCLCVVFKSTFSPQHVLQQLRMMISEELKSVLVIDTKMRPYDGTMERMLVCNTTKRRSDTCEIKGDVRIHGSSSTIFVSTSRATNSSWSIKPYARKGDENAMQNITNFIIKTTQEKDETMPRCTKTHNVPAIVFSVGGYSGNNFHSFSDIIIPLYATSRKYNREVRFLVTNKRPEWTSKFQDVLNKLSNYPIIDIDNESEVHCFSSMVIGLEKHDHKELNMDSMSDFTRFLRSTYRLNRSNAIKLTKNPTTKNATIVRARLLIVSRKRTRAFTNVNEIVTAAREVGFEVIVSEMGADLKQISRLVNSCDVMIGVHGAGLTNMVFMPENGVVIQVVPLGKMEWMARNFYGEPAKGMGLNYLEYKLTEGESTLTDLYPVNSSVIQDPYSIQRKGWEAYKSIYLDKQDVKINVVRFKEVLSKALELLH